MFALAILPFISPTVLSELVFKLIIALTAFTEYQDLVLKTLGLAINSHIIMDYAKIIWVHK